MIWEVPGLEVGHWTDPEALTGCTVVLCPVGGAVASGEVRGGAPATREFALLDPAATVERVDAVVLSGGSAFGLAAADGVMSWCEERDRGVMTVAGRVPIVIGMSLFDLGVGNPMVRPSAANGREAADAAPSMLLGAVGAGCGATVSKWRGPASKQPGGLVGATARDSGVVVAALVAVNAVGDVEGYGPSGEPWPPAVPDTETEALFGPSTNTTIGVVATSASIDKAGCLQLARSAHDGLARAITPPHSTVDGDAFVVLSVPDLGGPASRPAPSVPIDRLKLMTVDVIDRALRSLGRRTRDGTW